MAGKTEKSKLSKWEIEARAVLQRVHDVWTGTTEEASTEIHADIRKLLGHKSEPVEDGDPDTPTPAATPVTE